MSKREHMKPSNFLPFRSIFQYNNNKERMTIDDFFKRDLTINNHIITLFENGPLALGYTHRGTTLDELTTLIPGDRHIQLTQIHSDVIIPSHQIHSDSRGDGILLTEINTIGIIKTADCVPLFFWNQQLTTGGILHVGWRGLHRGIEIKLLPILKKMGVLPSEMHFYLGPAIQKECYTVSEDLHQKFSDKSYCKQIFQKNRADDYQMDLKKGITMSLVSLGIPRSNIRDSGICTSCHNTSFPSYRFSGGSSERIYNFIMLRTIF